MSVPDDILNVVMTTYDGGDGQRAALARRTLESLVKNLSYPHVHYIVSDDSTVEEYEKHIGFITEPLVGLSFETLVHNRQLVGHSKNVALKRAFDTSDYVLLIEDDWEMQLSMDFTAYMSVLQDYPSTGIIRLGYLGGDHLTAVLRAYGYHTFWHLTQGSDVYIYSGQVSLRHQRFYKVVGYHAENRQAGDEELELCKRYNGTVGAPDILYPANLGVTLNAGLFKNIGFECSTNAVTA
jgi:hypothetical protein